MKFIANFLRIIGALLVPILAGLYLLEQARPEFQAGELEVPTQRLDVGEAEALREVAIQLELPDGNPAVGAELLVIKPVVSYAMADEAGNARLRIPPGGEIEFYAYSFGMTVLHWGPEPRAPQSTLRFSVLPDRGPQIELPEGRLTARLQLRDRVENDPIKLAMFVIRREGFPDDAPWIGFTGPEGRVEIQNLPAGPLIAEVHAPGLPASAAALLGEARFEAGSEEHVLLAVDAAWLSLQGLPADALAELTRIGMDAEFQDRLVERDGSLEIGPLPPGQYVLKIGTEERELLLLSGRHISR